MRRCERLTRSQCADGALDWVRERGYGEGRSRKVEGQEAKRFLIEPEGRMFRIELRCAGAKGSHAPNAPMALWIGCVNADTAKDRAARSKGKTARKDRTP